MNRSTEYGISTHIAGLTQPAVLSFKLTLFEWHRAGEEANHTLFIFATNGAEYGNRTHVTTEYLLPEAV